jgi:hypothetical protein
MNSLLRLSARPMGLCHMHKLWNIWATAGVVLLLFSGFLFAQETGEWRVVKRAGARFVAVDVLVDAGAHSLAAYQVTVTAKRGDVKIVGIEGGEPPAFKQPPYYDPKAMQREKVILAAFNIAPAAKLPRGQTRVATLHLQVSGAQEPAFAAKLETAANADGKPISAKVNLQERKMP